MKSSDDENTDEWIESYDEYDTDEEIDDNGIVTMPVTKSNANKRAKVSEDSNGSSAESDGTAGSSESESEVKNENFKLKSNPAWADAMAKILRSKKTCQKKAIVLSKAKKLSDVKEKKKPKLDFEIVGAAEEENSDSDEKEDKKSIFTKKFAQKEYQTRGRVKASILDKDREKTLMKIATKGVVQLFNVVRQQQKTVDKTLKTAGKSEVKREKLLENIDKKKFLHMLTRSANS